MTAWQCPHSRSLRHPHCRADLSLPGAKTAACREGSSSSRPLRPPHPGRDVSWLPGISVGQVLLRAAFPGTLAAASYCSLLLTPWKTDTQTHFSLCLRFFRFAFVWRKAMELRHEAVLNGEAGSQRLGFPCSCHTGRTPGGLDYTSLAQQAALPVPGSSQAACSTRPLLPRASSHGVSSPCGRGRW